MASSPNQLNNVQYPRSWYSQAPTNTLILQRTAVVQYPVPRLKVIQGWHFPLEAIFPLKINEIAKGRAISFWNHLSLRPGYIFNWNQIIPRIGSLVNWFIPSLSDTCGGDFHFYRLDDGGLWSHKPGQTGATRLDDSGANITDPRSADTGAYIFQRFLVVNNNTVRIIWAQWKRTLLCQNA